MWARFREAYHKYHKLIKSALIYDEWGLAELLQYNNRVFMNSTTFNGYKRWASEWRSLETKNDILDIIISCDLEFISSVVRAELINTLQLQHYRSVS